VYPIGSGDVLWTATKRFELLGIFGGVQAECAIRHGGSQILFIDEALSCTAGRGSANANTNFPMVAEGLAAVTDGQPGLCQPRRCKASAFRGVCLAAGKYKSQITVDNQHHYLGVYATEEEAAKAYDRQGE
jgi:hypothetical protein